MTDQRHLDEQLDEYLDGNLAASELAIFEEHLAGCARCSRELERALRLQRTLAALPVEEPPEERLEAMLLAATRPRRARGWVGWAAGLAAAAVLAALILPGLRPEPPTGAGLTEVALTVNMERTVNLVFASADALEGVALTVDLPAGVEIEGRPGLRQLHWTTRLRAGNNILPLTLRASGGEGGELVATLKHDATERTFRISIEVVPG